MIKTNVKERPIPFSDASILTIQEGRKVMTRRVIKGHLPWLTDPVQFYATDPDNRDGLASPAVHYEDGRWWWYEEEYPEEGGIKFRCPYGVAGDRLWVKETWRAAWAHVPGSLSGPGVRYRADNAVLGRIESPCSGVEEKRWRHWLFMPRWASRIVLEITEVKAQRLQDITTGGVMRLSDVEKEGCPTEFCSSLEGDPMGSQEAAWFIKHWDSLNKKRGFGWDANPWVWSIEFKQVTQNSQ